MLKRNLTRVCNIGLNCFNKSNPQHQSCLKFHHRTRQFSEIDVRMFSTSRTVADEEVVDEDDSKKNDVYEKAEAYWASVSCDVDGMLGGFAHLHLPDMSDSKKFISNLKAKNYLMNYERAIDCGCGIGRITKHLLLPIFKTVDMVDVTENFIAESSKYIGADDKRVGQKFVCGLQDFEPLEHYYDLIWVQWVTGHLTDEDFMRFFRRCKDGIREGGCIVLKENVSSSEDRYDFDAEDNSWTRPKDRIVELLRRAGLTILNSRKQTHFPRGMLDVYMFALK